MLKILLKIILFILSGGFWWPSSSSEEEAQPQRGRAYEIKQMAAEAKEYNDKYYLGGYILSAIALLVISLLFDYLILLMTSGSSSPLVIVAIPLIFFSSVICGFIPQLYAYARILHANNLQQEAFWIGVARSLQVLSWSYAIIKIIFLSISLLLALGRMGG